MARAHENLTIKASLRWRASEANQIARGAKARRVFGTINVEPLRVQLYVTGIALRASS